MRILTCKSRLLRSATLGICFFVFGFAGMPALAGDSTNKDPYLAGIEKMRNDMAQNISSLTQSYKQFQSYSENNRNDYVRSVLQNAPGEISRLKAESALLGQEESLYEKYVPLRKEADEKLKTDPSNPLLPLLQAQRDVLRYQYAAEKSGLEANFMEANGEYHGGGYNHYGLSAWGVGYDQLSSQKRLESAQALVKVEEDIAKNDLDPQLAEAKRHLVNEQNALRDTDVEIYRTKGWSAPEKARIQENKQSVLEEITRAEAQVKFTENKVAITKEFKSQIDAKNKEIDGYVKAMADLKGKIDPDKEPVKFSLAYQTIQLKRDIAVHEKNILEYQRQAKIDPSQQEYYDSQTKIVEGQIGDSKKQLEATQKEQEKYIADKANQAKFEAKQKEFQGNYNKAKEDQQKTVDQNDMLLKTGVENGAKFEERELLENSSQQAHAQMSKLFVENDKNILTAKKTILGALSEAEEFQLRQDATTLGKLDERIKQLSDRATDLQAVIDKQNGSKPKEPDIASAEGQNTSTVSTPPPNNTPGGTGAQTQPAQGPSSIDPYDPDYIAAHQGDAQTKINQVQNQSGFNTGNKSKASVGAGAAVGTNGLPEGMTEEKARAAGWTYSTGGAASADGQTATGFWVQPGGPSPLSASPGPTDGSVPKLEKAGDGGKGPIDDSPGGALKLEKNKQGSPDNPAEIKSGGDMPVKENLGAGNLYEFIEREKHLGDGVVATPVKEYLPERSPGVVDGKKDLADLARKTILQDGGVVDVEGPKDQPTKYTVGKKDEQGNLLECVHSNIQYGTEKDKDGNALPTSYEETIKDSTGQEIGYAKKMDVQYGKDGKESSYQELLTRNIKEKNPESGVVEEKEVRTLTVVRPGADGKPDVTKATTVRGKTQGNDWGEWKEVDIKGEKSKAVMGALQEINKASSAAEQSGGSSNGAKAAAHKRLAELRVPLDEKLVKLDQLQASMDQKTQEIDRAIQQGDRGFKVMQQGDKVEGQTNKKMETEGEKTPDLSRGH